MINEYSSRLKLILQSENVSIADFCRIIGLNSTGTIHKLIADNRKPSSKTVERIIAAFPQVTEEWLLYGRGSYGETPKQKLLEDDLTLTASQVIDFIIKDLPSKIDQRDNATASILLERLNDIDNKFELITNNWDSNYESHVEKFDGYETTFENASFLLETLVERVTVLENYALLTLDEKSKLRAKKDKQNRNK